MQVQFEWREQGREAIRIVQLLPLAGRQRDAEAVIRRLSLGDKKSRGMRPPHHDDLVANQHGSVDRLRQPGPDLPFVRSQVGEWIAMAALYDQLSLSRGHLSYCSWPLLLQE